jgi:ribosomal protein S18 acetylase RimI-like enzyme
MEEILIRRAVGSDVERLVELRLLLQQHAEESSRSIWRITEEGKRLLKQKVVDDLAGSGGLVLVAEMGGKIIGFVHGEVIHRTDYLPRSVGSILTAYVAREFRRRGVGARLIEELCVFFNSEGVEDVTLRYVIGNREAEAFWKKLGFKPVITSAKASLRELKSTLTTQDAESPKDGC